MVVDKFSVREQNESLVLSTIFENAPISRAKISQITGLNKASISEIVRKLINDFVILERGVGNSSNLGGRKPIMLEVNASAGYSLCIDLGYDYIHSLLTDLCGNVIQQNYEQTEEISKENVVDYVLDTVQAYKKYYENSEFQLIGVTLAVHGITHENQIVFTPNYDIDQLDLATEIKDQLQIPVYLENEANLAALGEYTFSSAKSNLVSISIHSGIGAGIMLDGELFTGKNGQSGEIGHMILFPHGKECPCGNQGCLEQYCSEKAILKEYRKRANDSSLKLKDLREGYENGVALEVHLVNEAASYLSIGINNVISNFAPDIVYLNTRLFTELPFLLDLIQQGLTNKFNKNVELLESSLNSHATLLGGCITNLKKFLNIPRFHLNEEDVLAEVQS